MRLFTLFLAALLIASPAAARDPVTPDQRLDRLEKQVRQVQRQIFPKGQPADTAGFSDAPAATRETVDTLTGRLDAIEKQMSDLVRSSEEHDHRLSVMETDFARFRAEQDGRFKSIETGASAAAAGAPVPATGAASTNAAPVAPPELVRPTSAPVVAPNAPTAPSALSSDFIAAGEAAYTKGFDQWTAKQYDQAITQLRAMASSFPGHRRVSWANNLVGRALLDKGEPRAAAEALLANYRGDAKGERAPDSLFYLGQSLVKLGQTSQACKAYAELGAVYGLTMRLPLKAMLPAARAQAQCK